MNKRRVYIVDDEEPIRRAIQLMLRAQGYEVGLFDSGPALLESFESLEPGCILLDVRMPQMDGLEVQQSLQGRGSQHSVIVMTGHGDVTVAVQALQNGAAAFLEKPFAKAALGRALEIGFLRLEDPDAFQGRLDAAAAAVEQLSPSERSVLVGLATGQSNDAIAAEIAASTAAVELRRASIFTALGVENLTEALTVAHAAGLVAKP